MSFFGDLGTSLSDLFSGRWTGGETNLAHDNLTPLATLGGAAALGGLAAPALGGLFAGGEAAAGAAGTGIAEGAAGLAPEATSGVSAFSPIAGDFEALGFGSELPSEITGGASAGSSGGNLGQILAPYSANPDMVTGALSAPDAIGGTGPMAPGATPGAGGSFLDTLTSPSQWTLPGVAKGAGVAVAGGGLLANLMKGNSPSANQDKLTNMAAFDTKQAQALTAEGKQLREYLENGSLPPAQQAAVDQAVKAEKARLISNAAKNGQSTDPTQNTALSQDLAAADRNGLIAAGQLEQQLFAAGQNLLQSSLTASGLSSQIYQVLAQMDRADTADLNKAIATFAAAAGGSTINLSLGGQKAA
jgi:hypothetical protein